MHVWRDEWSGSWKLIDDTGETNGEALRARAAVTAAALGPDIQGRPVLIDARRGRPFVEALLAVWHAGGVAVPLEPTLPNAERDWIVADARPAALLRSDAAGVLLIDRCTSPREPLATPRGDIALILYTSGTTARPKGALITHENLAAQTAALIEAWGLRAGETVLHALPLHHLHGLVVALLAPLRAGAIVKMIDRFDAARVYDEMAFADVWMAVPTMYQRLLATYDAANLATQSRYREHARHLRLATSGSAALPTRYAEAWRAIAGAIPLERYGMTELGIALSNPLAVDDRRLGAVGRPMPGVTIALVPPASGDHPDGAAELWVRGDNVFAGYLDRPAVNAEVFSDGWFRTGDLVTTLDDGSLKILGRLSTDILKCAGHKLSALEIEEALREHAGVAEVAVVGVPDEALGDRVVAAVVPAADAPTTDALQAWIATRLAREKRPRQIVYVDALPKNALGKVQKPQLVQKLASRL